MKNLLVAAMAVLVCLGCQSATGNKPAVTMKGGAVTLVGGVPAVGQPARPFTAVANDLSTYTFTPGGGVTIISVVPSLDTGVCSAQTKRFNEAAATLKDVKVVTISMDLPFAQKRWCGAENVKNLLVVSDSRDRAFGDAYGLRMKENGLLARAVFVVGHDGKIAYREVVAEITKEPDYAAALAAAMKASW